MNPFNKEKDNLNQFDTGFYYCYKYNNLAFLEKNNGFFIGTYYLVYFKDLTNPERISTDKLHEMFKPLEFNDIKQDIEGFVKDIKWLVRKGAIEDFIGFLLENEEYEILGFCHNALKQSPNEGSSKEKKKED